MLLSFLKGIRGERRLNNTPRLFPSPVRLSALGSVMKAIILFALIVITGADVWQALQPCQEGDESQGFIHSEGGQLLLRYELPDGTKVSEQGILKPNADGSGNVLVKKGSFQFVSPEGTPFSLSYIADEHGYRVKSDSISAASLGADAFFRR